MLEHISDLVSSSEVTQRVGSNHQTEAAIRSSSMRRQPLCESRKIKNICEKAPILAQL